MIDYFQTASASFAIADKADAKTTLAAAGKHCNGDLRNQHSDDQHNAVFADESLQ